MQTAEIVIENRSGLHARPGKVFSARASQFASAVRIENLTRGAGPADAKSILGLLTLGVSQGHRVRLSADGPDEEDALNALVDLIHSGLGEPTGEPAAEGAEPTGEPAAEGAS
jgi:phosphotransferase system HPr (HPr) family protein